MLPGPLPSGIVTGHRAAGGVMHTAGRGGLMGKPCDMAEIRGYGSRGDAYQLRGFLVSTPKQPL